MLKTMFSKSSCQWDKLLRVERWISKYSYFKDKLVDFVIHERGFFPRVFADSVTFALVK